MTKEQNAAKQRAFQKRRRFHNLAAFRWIMAKVNGSKRGLRLIQVMLRKVGTHPESTPAQLLSASKWLLYIETGKRIPTEAELPSPTGFPPPLTPTEVEPNSVVANPTIGPDDNDPEVVALASKLPKV
jgi:hypothetical protein